MPYSPSSDDDTINAGALLFSIDGLDGIDTIILDYLSSTYNEIPINHIHIDNYGYSLPEEGVYIHIYSGDLLAEVKISNFEKFDISGTDGNDFLNAFNSSGSIFFGLGGNDRLIGSAGHDVLSGGDGNDSFFINSGVGDIIDGGDGVDTLELGFWDRTDNLFVDMRIGSVDGAAVTNIDLVGGSLGSGNDTILIGKIQSSISGGQGIDRITIDQSIYEKQTQTYYSISFFGYDNPFITYWDERGQIENAFIYNFENIDIIGGAGNDTLYGTVNDNLFEGRDGTDYLVGGGGNDTLIGGADADALFGEIGDDVLDGGAGDDNLHGGSGQDILIGGIGADCFYFDTPDDQQDIISDYNWAQGDRIIMDIAALDIKIFGNDVIILNYRRFPEPISVILKDAASSILSIEEYNASDPSGIKTTYTYDLSNETDWIINKNYYRYGSLYQYIYEYDDGHKLIAQLDDENISELYQSVSIYQPSNILSSVDHYYDDGSRLYINIDYGNTKNWRQDWFAYDIHFRLDNEDVLYDDGTRTFINVDEASNQTWTQDWFAYDALGHLSSEDVLYDDGTRTFINLDEASNQTWTQDWFAYDALGHLSSEDVFYDNGTRTYINLDENNSQVWSQAWFTYDNQGRLDTQDVFNDDGSRIFYNYDQDNSQTFTLTAFLYDNTGHAYQQVIAWDDGSMSYVNL